MTALPLQKLQFKDNKQLGDAFDMSRSWRSKQLALPDACEGGLRLPRMVDTSAHHDGGGDDGGGVC